MKFLELDSKEVRISSLLNIGIHIFCFITGIYVFHWYGIIPELPNVTNISQWDANWYKSIVDSGYSYDESKQSNVAFFPLFPLIWRMLGLSTIGISLFNALCMVGGVLILKKSLKFPNWHLYLYLSIPSLIFTFAPFSEGVFFLALATIIYGFSKNYYIALLGVLMACLTRSAAYTFAPIFFIMFIIQSDKNTVWRELIKLIGLLVVSFLGVLLAKWIQFLEVGQWFGVFDVFKHWHREISFPTFYLTTWDGPRLLWLDGSSLFIGLCCMFIVASIFVKKIKGSKVSISPDYLFSLAYLGVVTGVIVLFAYEDAKGGTSIFSLNRYVYATAPFIGLLSFLFHKAKFSLESFSIFVIGFILCWFAFGGGRELNLTDVYWGQFIKQNIYIFGVGGFLLVFYLFIQSKKSNIFHVVFYVALLSIQLFLFSAYLKSYWIG